MNQSRHFLFVQDIFIFALTCGEEVEILCFFVIDKGLGEVALPLHYACNIIYDAIF